MSRNKFFCVTVEQCSIYHVSMHTTLIWMILRPYNADKHMPIIGPWPERWSKALIQSNSWFTALWTNTIKQPITTSSDQIGNECTGNMGNVSVNSTNAQGPWASASMLQCLSKSARCLVYTGMTKPSPHNLQYWYRICSWCYCTVELFHWQLKVALHSCFFLFTFSAFRWKHVSSATEIADILL